MILPAFTVLKRKRNNVVNSNIRVLVVYILKSYIYVSIYDHFIYIHIHHFV